MRIKLKDFNSTPPKNWDKKDIKDSLKEIKEEITILAELLFANKKQSLLIILQGIDASGKDGTTWEVFSGLSPDWVHVSSFKKPNEEEEAHDYLWRIHQKIPAKGIIGVFNRSHYEDVLVPSVYKYIDQNIIEQRFTEINQFEDYLQKNGITILKFFLNISKSRQKEKLIERLELPEKHYKHSDDDWKTREHWDELMEAYEEVFNQCDKPNWHIVPADISLYRNYIVASVVLSKLKELNLSYPPLISKTFNPNDL